MALATLIPELIIDRRGLVPLVPLVPEGGFVGQAYLDERASAIKHLMVAPDVLGLHRLDHLEIWAWHAGSPGRMLLISPAGETGEPVLGPDLVAGEPPQVVVPGGWRQACEPLGDWTLASPFMAPPHADDAAAFVGGQLLAETHTDHAERIHRLARD